MTDPRTSISPKLYNDVRITNRPDPDNVWRLDRGALPLSSAMEQIGMRIDKGHMAALSSKLTAEMDVLSEQVSTMTDSRINIASADQLAALLFDKLKLKQQGKMKLTGSKKRLAADSDVLRGMVFLHPVVPVILQWKEREKLRSTFTLSLAATADSNDRIHASLNHTGPETGRYSCIAGHTVLETSRGEFNIQEYLPVSGDKIQTHAGRWKNIISKMYQGVDKIYRVCLCGGGILDCTAEHRLLTPTGWAELRNLSVGDSIVSYQQVKQLSTGNEGRSQGISFKTDQIREITYMGETDIWDIEVEGDHSYAAQGFINHNCSDPNLQTIPVRTKLGQEVRDAFIPSRGNILGTIDASQIEMRQNCLDSQCTGMLDIFWKWEDLYWGVAEGMYKREFTSKDRKEGIDPVSKLTFKEFYRFNAKTVSLAVTYATSPPGLVDIFLTSTPPAIAFLTDGKTDWDYKRDYDKAVEICSEKIKDFFEGYPEILTRRREHHRRARRYQFVWDMWGRIRWIPQVRSCLPWVVEEGLRAAGNMAGQGGASGVIKLWMAVVWDRLQNYWGRHGILPLMQIHDELLFEGPEKVMTDFLQECKYKLSNLIPFEFYNVPLESSFATGEKWGQVSK